MTYWHTILFFERSTLSHIWRLILGGKTYSRAQQVIIDRLFVVWWRIWYLGLIDLECRHIIVVVIVSLPLKVIIFVINWNFELLPLSLIKTQLAILQRLDIDVLVHSIYVGVIGVHAFSIHTASVHHYLLLVETTWSKIHGFLGLVIFCFHGYIKLLILQPLMIIYIRINIELVPVALYRMTVVLKISKEHECE